MIENFIGKHPKLTELIYACSVFLFYAPKFFLQLGEKCVGNDFANIFGQWFFFIIGMIFIAVDLFLIFVMTLLFSLAVNELTHKNDMYRGK